MSSGTADRRALVDAFTNDRIVTTSVLT